MAEPAVVLVPTHAPPPAIAFTGDTVTRAQAHEVTDQRTAAEASDLLSGVSALIKAVHEYHKPIKLGLDAVKKLELERERADSYPLEAVFAELKRKVGTYLEEQERIARQEAAEQARQQREAERAERGRQEAELIARGVDQAEAAERAEQESFAHVVVVDPVAKPKVAGISKRTRLEVEVVDIRQLCVAIGAGTDATDVMVKPNLTAIRQYANSHGGRVDIPGVRITRVPVVVSRG